MLTRQHHLLPALQGTSSTDNALHGMTQLWVSCVISSSPPEQQQAPPPPQQPAAAASSRSSSSRSRQQRTPAGRIQQQQPQQAQQQAAAPSLDPFMQLAKARLDANKPALVPGLFLAAAKLAKGTTALFLPANPGSVPNPTAACKLLELLQMALNGSRGPYVLLYGSNVVSQPRLETYEEIRSSALEHLFTAPEPEALAFLPRQNAAVLRWSAARVVRDLARHGRQPGTVVGAQLRDGVLVALGVLRQCIKLSLVGGSSQQRSRAAASSEDAGGEDAAAAAGVSSEPAAAGLTSEEEQVLADLKVADLAGLAKVGPAVVDDAVGEGEGFSAHWARRAVLEVVWQAASSCASAAAQQQLFAMYWREIKKALEVGAGPCGVIL